MTTNCYPYVRTDILDWEDKTSVIPFEKIEEYGAVHLVTKPHVTNPEDLSVVIFTSGSTGGNPKGSMFTDAALSEEMQVGFTYAVWDGS